MTIAAITFLFVILGVIQLAMILNAYSLVKYAAYNAARAGIVHGGDQAVMEEAVRLSLLPVFPRHGRADTQAGYVDNYLGAKTTDDSAFFGTDGKKITTVKIVTLESFGCGQTITFDDFADAPSSRMTFEVVHQYQMVIPLVNRILYWAMRNRGLGPKTATIDQIAAETDRQRRSASTDTEYRIPLVAHYTMQMQSDISTAACPTTTTTTSTTTSTISTTTTTSVATTTTSTTTTSVCVNHSGSCGTLTCGFSCPLREGCFIPWDCWPASCQTQCCPAGNGHCQSHYQGAGIVGYAGEPCSCN